MHSSKMRCKIPTPLNFDSGSVTLNHSHTNYPSSLINGSLAIESFTEAFNNSETSQEMLTIMTNPSNYQTIVDIVLYVELCFGLVLQILNAIVLNCNEIRSQTYTLYLRALNTMYLLAIMFMFLSRLRLNGVFDAFCSSWLIVAYVAHLELFMTNVFLFAGNTLALLLVAQTLLSLHNPFRDRVGSSILQSSLSIAACILIPTVLLLPVPFIRTFEQMQDDEDHFVQYCYGRRQMSIDMRSAYNMVRMCSACFFEMALLVIIVFLYSLIYDKYRLIRYENLRLQADVMRASRSNLFQKSDQDIEQAQPLQPEAASAKRRSGQSLLKATQICFGCIGAYVCSNLPSALKESLILVDYVFKPVELRLLLRAHMRVIADVCMIALFCNFSLSVLLQLVTSVHYKQCMHQLLMGKKPSTVNHPGTTTAITAIGKKPSTVNHRGTTTALTAIGKKPSTVNHRGTTTAITAIGKKPSTVNHRNTTKDTTAFHHIRSQTNLTGALRYVRKQTRGANVEFGDVCVERELFV